MEEDAEELLHEEAGVHRCTNDALLRVFSCLASGYAAQAYEESPAQSAAAFNFVKNVLPLVCKRWDSLLRATCPLWSTIVISASLSSTGTGTLHKTRPEPAGTPHSLGASPQQGPSISSPTWSSWKPSNALNRSSLDHMRLQGSSPRANPRHATSLSVSILRAERVINWVASRARHCSVLVLDISNPNHDFTARSIQQLLSLLRPSLRLLYLSDSPGQGRQEGYEVLSTLKSLQQLHIQGIPQDFLHLTMPYLALLPCLRRLHFKPDMASYPSPARLTSLPPSLQHLELIKIWVEQLPTPYNKPATASNRLQPPATASNQPQPPAAGSGGGAAGFTAAVVQRDGRASGSGLLQPAYLAPPGSPSFPRLSGPHPSDPSASTSTSVSAPLASVHRVGSLQEPFSVLVAVPTPLSLPQPAFPLRSVNLTECQVTGHVLICLASSPLSDLHLHKCTLVPGPAGQAPGPMSFGALALPQASPLRSLSLRACRVTYLQPALLAALTGLRALDISGNEELGLEPHALPAEFASLVHLTRLEMSGCGLVTLPPPVAALPALTHLNLELNALPGLPKQLACESTLEVANISCNRLTCLPPCLWGMTGLRQLVVSSGPVAGTSDFHTLHLKLPRLTHLQVKGATYDCRAVRNLMQLSSWVQRSHSTLQIDILV